MAGWLVIITWAIGCVWSKDMASLASLLSSFSPAHHSVCCPLLVLSSTLSSKACPLLCQARRDSGLCIERSRREMLTAGASVSLLSSLFSGSAALGILEADDDEQLLERVKEDRRRKIQKRGELNAYKKEAASVQTAIFKLSKAGQALDVNDFLSASSLLGSSLDIDWIEDVKVALSKLSSNDEERTAAKTFSSSLQSLQSAVLNQDLASSKTAFVASASALERWSALTGFAQQLKGL
eukprot:c34654_g1_i1 orf=655-1368(-)